MTARDRSFPWKEQNVSFSAWRCPTGLKQPYSSLFLCFSVTKLHIDWPSWKVELYRNVKSSLIITRYGLPTLWVQVALSTRSCGCFHWIFHASMSQNLLSIGLEVWTLSAASIVNSMIGKALVTCWCSQIGGTITECMSQVLYIAYQFTPNIISPTQRHVTGATWTCKYQ